MRDEICPCGRALTPSGDCAFADVSSKRIADAIDVEIVRTYSGDSVAASFEAELRRERESHPKGRWPVEDAVE